MSAHPNPASKQSNSMTDSVFSSGLRHSIIGQLDEPSPIDPSDPPAALEALRAFDHDHFLETLAKTGSTIRKWQKQCKEYRERAKGKIAFRNFAKGDLALFLPTRNSVSKPWAAFNGTSLHFSPSLAALTSDPKFLPLSRQFPFPIISSKPLGILLNSSRRENGSWLGSHQYLNAW